MPYLLQFSPPSSGHQYVLTTEGGLPFLFRESTSAQDWFRENTEYLLLKLTEDDHWRLKRTFSPTPSVNDMWEATNHLTNRCKPCSLTRGVTPPPEILWGDIPVVPGPQITYSEETDTLYFIRDPADFLPVPVDDVLIVCRSAKGPRRVVRIAFSGMRARLSSSKYQPPDYPSDYLYRVLAAASPSFDNMDLHTHYMYELAFTVVGTERVPEDLLKKLFKPLKS